MKYYTASMLIKYHHQSELVGDVAVPVSVRSPDARPGL